jgi:hypothetical protein
MQVVVDIKDLILFYSFLGISILAILYIGFLNIKKLFKKKDKRTSQEIKEAILKRIEEDKNER